MRLGGMCLTVEQSANSFGSGQPPADPYGSFGRPTCRIGTCCPLQLRLQEGEAGALEGVHEVAF